MRKARIIYFEQGGPENTLATLEAAKDRAFELRPEAVIVASISGKTALEAGRIFDRTGHRIIAVPFQKHLAEAGYGASVDPQFVEPARHLDVEFLPDDPQVPLLDGDHPDIVNAWRNVSSGFKAALQVASMCVDVGLIRPGARVIAIGGSGHGADTAVVVQTYGQRDILQSKVVEILAMPCA